MEDPMLLFQANKKPIKRIKRAKEAKANRVGFIQMRNWYKQAQSINKNDSTQEFTEEAESKRVFIPRKIEYKQKFKKPDFVANARDVFNLDMPVFFNQLDKTEADPKFVSLINRTENELNNKITQEIDNK